MNGYPNMDSSRIQHLLDSSLNITLYDFRDHHWGEQYLLTISTYFAVLISQLLVSLQCFDTVGWAAGRVSGL